MLAGNQPFSQFPMHAQGRVRNSAEFLKSPYSLLHRVWHFQCKIQLSAVCAGLHWFRLERVYTDCLHCFLLGENTNWSVQSFLKLNVEKRCFSMGKNQANFLWRKFALKLSKRGLCQMLFTALKKIYSNSAKFWDILNLSLQRHLLLLKG